MEWLTIALSSLLTILTPAGAILDSVLAGAIRSQVREIESLSVRVDNTPSYQALQGKIERVRIAGRGVYPITDFRVAAIDLETDTIHIDLSKLQQRRKNPLEALRQPASGAFRVVLSEADINQALQAPEIQKQLQSVMDRLVPRREETGNQILQLRSARVDFQPDNRVAIALEVRSSREDGTDETVNLSLESGFALVGGRKLQFLEPSGTLNGRRLSRRLLQGFAEGIVDRFDLASFETQGIFVRVLQFQGDDDKLQIAVFARLDPRSGNSIAP
jgi:hypothetical protein